MYKISNPILLHRRRQLRKLMRGYRRVMSSGKMIYLRELESELATHEIRFVNGFVEKMVFGSSYPKAQVIVRQFLLQFYAGPPLHKALLSTFGDKRTAISYPLPNSWQRLLLAHGMRLNRITSLLAWFWVILSRYLHGALIIVLICIRFGRFF